MLRPSLAAYDFRFANSLYWLVLKSVGKARINAAAGVLRGTPTCSRSIIIAEATSIKDVSMTFGEYRQPDKIRAVKS
jgi:hypothetical protein